MTDCLTEEESILEKIVPGGLCGLLLELRNCSGRWVERFWRWKTWSCKIIVAECGVGTWSTVTKFVPSVASNLRSIENDATPGRQFTFLVNVNSTSKFDSLNR